MLCHTPREMPRFELSSRLATGGMAEIFIARQRFIGGVERKVALKRILPALSRDQQFVTAFLQEAAVASQLSHPNIVKIYDFGEERGRYFIAMEYVPGCDLATLLELCREREQFIPVPVALRIMADICAALDHAHRALGSDGQPLAVVHRDVTPSNVLISLDGPAKLTDFGIAKAATRMQARTRTGTVKGKLSYLAPEQVTAKSFDRRVDIYAAGITLWEMLAGRHAFHEGSEYETLSAIAAGRLPELGKWRSGLSAELQALVGKATALDPEARFAAAGEMLDAIEALSEAQSHGTVKNFAAPFFSEAHKRRAPRPITQWPDWPRRWAWLMLLPLAFVVMWMWWPRHRQTIAALDSAAAAAVSLASEPAGAQVLWDGVLLSGATPFVLTAVDGTRDHEATFVWAAPRREQRLRVPRGFLSPYPLLATPPARVPEKAAQPEVSRALPPPAIAPLAVKHGTGRLRLAVRPWGELQVDGALIGTTPLPPLDLAPGEHRVVVGNRESGKAIDRRIVIRSGEETVVRADLR